MLMPKRTKYRKMFKGRVRGVASRGATVAFGDYGLQAVGAGWLTSRQLEATRIAITRHMKRVGQVWIRVYPDKPYTKKPLETRMGKGKGNVEGWVAVIRPGNMILEISGCPELVAREALSRAASKIPFRCRMLSRH